MTERGWILNQLQKGIPPETVAREYIWKDLSLIDREALLAEVKTQGDSKLGFDLIRFLFCLSEDDWDTAEILIRAVRHPFPDQTGKAQTFKTLDLRLSKIEKSLQYTPQDKNSIQKANKLRLRYFFLLGQFQQQEGQIKEAILSYQEAQNLALDLGASSPAAKLELTIQELLESQEGRELLSEEELEEDDHPQEPELQENSSKLQQQEQQILENERYLAKLQGLIKEESQKLNSIEERIKDLKIEAESIELQAQNLNNKNAKVHNIEELEKRAKELTGEIKLQEERILGIEKEILDKENQLMILNDKVAQVDNEIKVDKSVRKNKPLISGIIGDVPSFISGQ